MRYLLSLAPAFILTLSGCAGGYMYVESDIPGVASYGNDLQLRVAESVTCSHARTTNVAAKATMTATNRTANRERYELTVRCQGLKVK